MNRGDEVKSKMGCVTLRDLSDRAPYYRFKAWYFCFYVGLPTLAVFCAIYAFNNPDDENCWYGERRVEKIIDDSEIVDSTADDESGP